MPLWTVPDTSSGSGPRQTDQYWPARRKSREEILCRYGSYGQSSHRYGSNWASWRRAQPPTVQQPCRDIRNNKWEKIICLVYRLFTKTHMTLASGLFVNFLLLSSRKTSTEHRHRGTYSRRTKIKPFSFELPNKQKQQQQKQTKTIQDYVVQGKVIRIHFHTRYFKIYLKAVYVFFYLLHLYYTLVKCLSPQKLIY